jgi:hypothetical protein
MFQVTFIRANQLHTLTTPNLYAALAAARSIKGARLWTFLSKQVPTLLTA